MKLPVADLEYTANINPDLAQAYPPPRCACVPQLMCAACARHETTRPGVRTANYQRVAERMSTPKRAMVLEEARRRARNAVKTWLDTHGRLFTFRDLVAHPLPGLTTNIVYGIYDDMDGLWKDCLAHGVMTPQDLRRHRSRIATTRRKASFKGGRALAKNLRNRQKG